MANNKKDVSGLIKIALYFLVAGSVRACQNTNHVASPSYQFYSDSQRNQYPQGSSLFTDPSTTHQEEPPERNPYETTFPDN